MSTLAGDFLLVLFGGGSVCSQITISTVAVDEYCRYHPCRCGQSWQCDKSWGRLHTAWFLPRILLNVAEETLVCTHLFWYKMLKIISFLSITNINWLSEEDAVLWRLVCERRPHSCFVSIFTLGPPLSLFLRHSNTQYHIWRIITP